MELSPPLRLELEAQMALAVTEMMTAARSVKQGLVQPRRLEPVAVVLSPKQIAVAQILDVSMRIDTLRAAMRQVPDAYGFIFLYDGWVEAPERQEALLSVAGTTWGHWVAEAHRYAHTGLGHTFLDPILVPDVAQLYARVVAP